MGEEVDGSQQAAVGEGESQILYIEVRALTLLLQLDVYMQRIMSVIEKSLAWSP